MESPVQWTPTNLWFQVCGPSLSQIFPWTRANLCAPPPHYATPAITVYGVSVPGAPALPGEEGAKGGSRKGGNLVLPHLTRDLLLIKSKSARFPPSWENCISASLPGSFQDPLAPSSPGKAEVPGTENTTPYTTIHSFWNFARNSGTEPCKNWGIYCHRNQWCSQS